MAPGQETQLIRQAMHRSSDPRVRGDDYLRRLILAHHGPRPPLDRILSRN